MSDSTSIPAAQMKLVLDVSRKLAVTSDLDVLLNTINESARMLLQAERCSIFLHDPGPDQLWTKVATGTGEIRVPSSAGIVGSVFKSNSLINIPDAYADQRFNRAIDQKTGFKTRNLLTAPLPDVHDRPVGVIQAVNRIAADSFNPADEMLVRLLADQAGVAIQRYQLQQAATQAAALQRELDLAKKVQDDLLPKTLPECATLDLAGWTQSATTNGGDVYDLWMLSDGRLALFLADASGHGIAPALVVSQARTLVRALAELVPDPAQLLSRVNNRLSEDLDAGMFVTAFLAFIEPNGAIRWFSAGHGPVLVREALNDPMQVLEPTMPPLGVIPDWPDEGSMGTHLGEGGLLAVITDGIFEAFDPQREQFGLEKTQAILDECRDKPVKIALDLIKQKVNEWQAGGEPTDDQTIVLVKRRAT